LVRRAGGGELSYATAGKPCGYKGFSSAEAERIAASVVEGNLLATGFLSSYSQPVTQKL
jgi:hypothetical protein